MFRKKNLPTIIAYIVADIIFILVAAWAVMYATGYRVDFRDWSIRKTGVLAITTKPNGADVYINDKKYARKTPITLRNMLPGDYAIKLSLEDYLPFNKTIKIVSRKVTEEHNLDLVLNEITPKILAQDVGKMILAGNEPIYFNKQRQFVKLVNEKTVPLNFDRLPTNVKSVLQSATDIYMAKKFDSGNALALGVIANGRKWLMITDLQEGYRGQLFSSPLNQLTAEKLIWMDNNKFIGLLGGSVYAVDIIQNKINIYIKNSLGADYQNNKLYYVVRETNGSISLMRDGNLFDERVAERLLTDLPVGKIYSISFINDERVILTTDNAGVKGLWLGILKQQDGKLNAVWTKVASNISGVAYEHQNLKPKLFFTSSKILGEYDFAVKQTQTLHTFAQNVQLLTKRDESLFLDSNSRLLVGDVAGVNIYDIASIDKSNILFGKNARKIWILRNSELTELELRGSGIGILGNVNNWWSNPVSRVAE